MCKLQPGWMYTGCGSVQWLEYVEKLAGNGAKVQGILYHKPSPRSYLACSCRCIDKGILFTGLSKGVNATEEICLRQLQSGNLATAHRFLLRDSCCLGT